MRVKSLQDLKPVRKALAAAARQAALLAEEQRRIALRPATDRALFLQAIGAVRPLRHAGNRLVPLPGNVLPVPQQRLLDEQAVLREAISDEFDVSTLLLTDDQLSYLRPGMGQDVAHRLRAGHWSIQRQLDLHGLRTDEAREALGEFIRHAQRDGARCVRVVHGKGLGSPGRMPVLKGRVHSWLVQKQEVLAFVQARPADGGAGALVVLLQPHVRRQGGR
ncbi:Smr/MutS family protein [Acidovorax sp. CCYZU-2555]|uniref:Smr/MutS family protein n=1 Tax=Acidovorax sp. CCYZU-2555 TaxID=2835042 RepID=UPI001BCC715E|nr:Smr/MutS family protein [Acidovorax sp. CCYZU-2555]MBS7781456.1 Smr/MutS family protein [Acidovorax sp. CCYZU-2555]